MYPVPKLLLVLSIKQTYLEAYVTRLLCDAFFIE